MSSLKAVLFDCDGTIADSAGLICDIMERCFRANGLEPPAREATRAIIGLSLEKAMSALRPSLSDGEAKVLAESYRREYRIERTKPGFADHLFQGMEDLVRDLSAREDVLVGMVTGKSRRGVVALVESNELDGIFVAVRTADDCPSKPHPAMVLECCEELGIGVENTVVIGDTSFDMEMARSAGTASIGVGWGSHHPELLAASGASSVVATVPDLRQAIDRWLAAR